MKRENRILMLMVIAICSMFFLSNFYVNYVNADNDEKFYNKHLRDWAGDWGCSFQIDAPPLGPFASIAQLKIKPDGEVTGVTRAATAAAPPNDIVDCTVTGTITEIRDHYITFENVAVCEDLLPGQEFEQVQDCIGVLLTGKGYTELNCIDLTQEEEPAATLVSLSTCKRVELSNRRFPYDY